ncbi:MAG: YicC family protein [Candidatus Omnitrophica bacterium]|nr:YicC family protein [Candidatus Omnitrophota bacterium]
MIKSMTGFGSKETNILPFGKMRAELRSTNHKFLEIVLHVPEGFLSLEEKIKKAIEAKIKRGRVTCVISINGFSSPKLFIDKGLLKKYILELKSIKKQFRLSQSISLEALINLPGVMSLTKGVNPKAPLWPKLDILLNRALENLVQMRCREGLATDRYFRKQLGGLKSTLNTIKSRFKVAVRKKLACIRSDDERSSFLKDSDINEEIARLAFHLRNFAMALGKSGPIGKELDFIAQEMQREANTMGAKSFDAEVGAKVVEMRSRIEKIREQVQNIE